MSASLHGRGFSAERPLTRYPQLTEQGTALLAEARLVVNGMDGFKAKARTIAEGLEPELSVVVDVMYPMESLTVAVARRVCTRAAGGRR